MAKNNLDSKEERENLFSQAEEAENTISKSNETIEESASQAASQPVEEEEEGEYYREYDPAQGVFKKVYINKK